VKRVFLSVLILGTAFSIVLYGPPLFAAATWGGEYKNLMYECDFAMKEHFIAKQAVEANVDAFSVANLEASESSLVVCHDYDKLRKKLLTFGLNETHLSLLGLQVMEEKNSELSEFVSIHEIKY